MLMLSRTLNRPGFTQAGGGMRILLSAAGLLLAACFRDDGIVEPENPPPLLATFMSPGINNATSDTSALHREHKSDRILDLHHPQVALVWQFVGPQEFIRAPSRAVVNATTPFGFTLELRDPPAREILENPDVSIGQFWLYNDADSNGVLDRLIHPEMVPLNAAIDSLYRMMLDSVASLLAMSEIRAQPVLWTDTFYVGAYGTVSIKQAGWEETILRGDAPIHAKAVPTNVTGTRHRVLSMQDRWQRFFALRKRENDYFVTYRPALGYVHAMEVTYYRYVFPRPGQEREFERKFRDVVVAYTQYVLFAQDILTKAEKAGYQNYPYNQAREPGQDMVVARSRSNFVLYIPSRAKLDTILAAERHSSFSIRNLGRLAPGYNLLYCDDQYRCEVLPQGAPIRLDLGMTSAFFNPPSSGVENPVAIAAATAVPPGDYPLSARDFGRLAGVYDGLNYGFIRVAARDGVLWIDHPEEGLLRLRAVDSLRFLSPLRNTQFQFVLSDDGSVSKVFVVRAGNRYVGVRDPSQPRPDLEERVAAFLSGATLPVGGGDADIGALRFDYGGDTLRFEPFGGDSLRVLVPGMFPQRVERVGPSTYASRDLDLRLTLLADAAGRCPGLRAERNGRSVFSPETAYPARGPGELFPSLPDSLPDTVSAHPGSAVDNEPTLDGLPRFAVAGDSLFLRPGDGWVHGIGTAHPAGFALGQGGEHLLLRIPGLEGRAAAVTLVLLPERSAGKSRVRYAVRGGREAETQDEELGGGWIAFNGKPAVLTLGPFPVGADPYFVRIERIRTADREVHFAFAGYSAQSNR